MLESPGRVVHIDFFPHIMSLSWEVMGRVDVLLSFGTYMLSVLHSSLVYTEDTRLTCYAVGTLYCTPHTTVSYYRFPCVPYPFFREGFPHHAPPPVLIPPFRQEADFRRTNWISQRRQK